MKEHVPGNGKTLKGPVLESLVLVSKATIFRAQVNHKHRVKPMLQQFRNWATLVTQSFEGFVMADHD